MWKDELLKVPTNTFEKILTDASRRGILLNKGKESIQWLSSQAKSMTSTTSATLMREADGSELVNYNQIVTGKMYFFYYDSKLFKEKKLPYFDRFPCIFPIGPAKNGFYGINLHYLPYNLRAKLMDALYTIENSARYPRNKKLEISYSILKSTLKSNLFKPCIKHYLSGHVRSRFYKIPYEAWGIAAFLPVASFEGATDSTVWSDSKKKINVQS